MVLTLASVRSNTSAVLAILAADRGTMLTVGALVAFAALVHQPCLLDVNVLGDSADVHLGAGTSETGRFEAPTGRLVLVRLVCSHLGGHCVLFLSRTHVVSDHLTGHIVARQCESECSRRRGNETCDGKDCQERAGKSLAECCHPGWPVDRSGVVECQVLRSLDWPTEPLGSPQAGRHYPQSLL